MIVGEPAPTQMMYRLRPPISTLPTILSGVCEAGSIVEVGDGSSSTVGVFVRRGATEGIGCVTDEHAVSSKRESDRIKDLQAHANVFMMPSWRRQISAKAKVSPIYGGMIQGCMDGISLSTVYS